MSTSLSEDRSEENLSEGNPALENRPAKSRPESDPIRHTRQVRERLSDLIEHLRADVKKIDEPQAKALFETAAETLGGLKEAFSDYEEKNEAAWED